jgi:hypothetical protein
MDIVAGVLLTIGTVVSYVDQFFQLGLQWSHVGVSFSSLFFINWSAGMNTIDSFFQQWGDIQCCAAGHVLYCSEALLPSIQLLSNFVCQFAVYGLALVVFRSNGSAEVRRLRSRAWSGFLFLCALYAALFGAGVALIHWIGPGSSAFGWFDFALGIASAIPPFFCYLPQIWTSFRLHDRGSLSLVQFLIQTPGSFFVAGFQALNGLWIVSIPSFVLGLQQLVILIMLIYYLIRNWVRRRRRPPPVDGDADPNEATSAAALTADGAEGDLLMPKQF